MIVLTYDEWCHHMMIRIRYNGKEWHNTTDNRKAFIFDNWETGEQMVVPYQEMGKIKDLEIDIPIDPRYIPDGMRSYSDTIFPEYLSVSADRWMLKIPERFTFAPR